MTWTILVLLVGVALFVASSVLVKQGKKPNSMDEIIKKGIQILSIVLVSGSVCRLFTPYYLTNVKPEILKDMVASMQESEQKTKTREVREFVKSNKADMIKDAAILGKEDADKTIFLFSAYSCGYCRRVHSELAKVLEERDDVKVVLKQFSIHGPLSDAPAKAVIAAKLQGNDKAAKLDKMLMEKQYYTDADLKDKSMIAKKIHKNVIKLAKQAGLDVKKLEEDMKGEVVARELSQVHDLANRFQITGTPFLIIGEQAFPGAISYDQIMQALN